jgi:cytochrome c biogenesis protein
MVIGLAISFFLSHRRIWVQITPHDKQKTQILVSGTSNKYRLSFERHFDNLTTAIQQDA